MSRTFESLQIRNFRVFSAGTLLSNIGTWMQRVAQDWLVLVVTGSAGALGITTGLQFLPTLLLSPMAGVVADRFSKRVVVLWSQISMALAALALGVLAVAGVGGGVAHLRHRVRVRLRQRVRRPGAPGVRQRDRRPTSASRTQWRSTPRRSTWRA